MNIPQLPTDNLYKFLAIFGLVLFIFSAYMYNDVPDKLYLKVDDYNIKNETAQAESKKDSINTIGDNLLIQKIKLTVLEEQLNREVKKLPKLLSMYFVLAIAGLIIMSFGFILWYFKTQRFNDLILKNDSETIENSKEMFVHRIQFEKEFDIYNHLWKDLIRLRNYTRALRPKLETVKKDVKENDRRKKKIESFNKVFVACVETFEYNKPFYSNEIYEQVNEMILLAMDEAVDYNKNHQPENHWEKAEENVDKIVGLIDGICESIRERIGMIKIKN